MSAAAVAPSLEDVLTGDASNRVRIVSIYPIERKKEMAISRGFKMYTLPAAKRGGWTFCDVDPAAFWQPDRSESNLIDNKGANSMMLTGESAEVRARSLVDYWTSDLSLSGAAGGGRPGIGILPVGETEPSEAFLARLTQEQTLWAEAHLNHGNDLHRQGKTSAITGPHRQLVEWLLGTAAGRIEWVSKKDFQELKKCIACAEEIPTMAARCKHCSVDLMDYYRKHGLDIADDPALAALAAARKTPAPDPKVPIKQQVAQRMDERDAQREQAQTTAQSVPGRPLSPPVAETRA